MRGLRRYPYNSQAALASSGAAPTPYTQNLVTFDGTNDYLYKELSTGIVDGSLGIISGWYNFNGGDGSLVRMFHEAAGSVQLSKASDNKIQVILLNTSGVPLVSVKTDGLHVAADGLKHILASWSLTGTPAFHLLIDGVDVAKTYATAATNGIIDYLRTTAGTQATAIGASTSGTTKFTGQMGDFYFNPVAYLDLSNPTNVAKFIDGVGDPVSLGADGSTPTGSQPAIFFGDTMDAAAWNAGNGLGSIQGWTVNGAVA